MVFWKNSCVGTANFWEIQRISFPVLFCVLRDSHFSVAASGVLKGFDPLLNLVLDGTTEYLRGKLEHSWNTWINRFCVEGSTVKIS